MPYNKKTWSAGESLSATGLNQLSDNIAYALRCLVQDKKIAYGHKQLTFGGGVTIATGIVNFGNDAVDGDPGFTNAPFVIAVYSAQSGDSSGIAAGTIIGYPDGASVTNTSFTAILSFYNKDSFQPSAGTKASVSWFAIGE